MMSPEDKRYVLSELLRNIEHVADLEYQKRVWIEGRGPEVQDFDDFLELYVEDSEIIFPEYKSFGVTEKQYKLLKNFRDELSSFSNNPRWYLVEEFIDTPQWNRMMNLAKEVLEAFEYFEMKKVRGSLIQTQIIQSLSNLAMYQEEKGVLREGSSKDVEKIVSGLIEVVDSALQESGYFSISKREQELLRELRRKIDLFTNQYGLEEKNINAPQWREIKALANQIIQELELN